MHYESEKPPVSHTEHLSKYFFFFFLKIWICYKKILDFILWWQLKIQFSSEPCKFIHGIVLNVTQYKFRLHKASDYLLFCSSNQS